MPSSSAQDGVYSIHYDSANHISVLFQWTGSVWKPVLPYCIANLLISLTISFLKHNHDIDLGFSDKGHSMTTLFVSFLIVSRVNISLGRYNESRANLGKMYMEVRELVQNVMVFTKGDQSEKAKKWRLDLAYNISVQLLLSMAVLDYPTTNIPCWKIPELRGEAKEYIMKNLDLCSRLPPDRGVAEKNMRVPIQMSYLIREHIFHANKYLDDQNAIQIWQMGKLFGSVDSFMGSYYGLRKFLTTPFPFPLVQMARTFMFIYLYTLPFALLDQADSTWVHATVVFLVTYGFLGLESVSIQMDNPFGDDENDFDNSGMAMTALEDTYLTIHDADGEEQMMELMTLLTPDSAGGLATESTALLGAGMV